MECFTLFRKHLAMEGIIPQQSPQNSHFVNFHLKNLTVITFANLIAITTAKLISAASTFEEYADSVYRLIYIFGFNLFYAYIVWEAPKLFGFIESLEHIINKSKQRSNVPLDFKHIPFQLSFCRENF